MNLFSEIFRGITKLNPLNNGKFVFMSTEVAKPVAHEGGESEQQTGEPPKPFEAKNWKDHENRLNDHMRALKSAAPKAWENFKNNFILKLAELRKEYDGKLKELGNSHEKAANAIRDAVERFKKDIKKEAGPEQKRFEEEVAKTEPKPKPEAGTPGPEKKEKPQITAADIMALDPEQRNLITGAITSMILKDVMKNVKPQDRQEMEKFSREVSQDMAELFETAARFSLEKNPDVKKELGEKMKSLYKKLEERRKETLIKFPFINEFETRIRTALEPNNIRQTLEAAMKSDFKDKKGLGKAIGILETNVSNKENSKEKLTPEEIQQATVFICKKMKITDADWSAKIKELVPTLLTNEQIKLMRENKEFTLEPDQQKKIIESAPKLNDINREKVILLQNRIGKLLDSEGFTGRLKKEILGMFGEYKDPRTNNLSPKPLGACLVMKWDITEDKNALRINNNPINKIDEIVQYLPGDVQDNFRQILSLKGKPDAEIDSALDGTKKAPGLKDNMWNKSIKNLDNLANAKQTQNEMLQTIRNPERGNEGKNILELIVKFFSALKTGNLTDLIDEWNKFKNPNEFKNAKKNYEVKVRASQDIDSLTKAYLDPQGPEAEKLFGNKPKFRKESQDAIKEHLKIQLGMGEISGIIKLPNGRTEIQGYNLKGSQIAVELWKSEGPQKAEIKKFKEVTKGDTVVLEKVQMVPPMEFNVESLNQINKKINGQEEKQETVAANRYTKEELAQKNTPELQKIIDQATKTKPELKKGPDYLNLNTLKNDRLWKTDRNAAQKKLDDARRNWIIANVPRAEHKKG